MTKFESFKKLDFKALLIWKDCILNMQGSNDAPLNSRMT